MALRIMITVDEPGDEETKHRFGARLMDALSEFDSGTEITVKHFQKRFCVVRYMDRGDRDCHACGHGGEDDTGVVLATFETEKEAKLHLAECEKVLLPDWPSCDIEYAVEHREREVAS